MDTEAMPTRSVHHAAQRCRRLETRVAPRAKPNTPGHAGSLRVRTGCRGGVARRTSTPHTSHGDWESGPHGIYGQVA